MFIFLRWQSTLVHFVLSNFYDGPPFILEVAVFKCARTCLDAPYTWESNPQYATNALTLSKLSPKSDTRKCALISTSLGPISISDSDRTDQ